MAQKSKIKKTNRFAKKAWETGAEDIKSDKKGHEFQALLQGFFPFQLREQTLVGPPIPVPSKNSTAPHFIKNNLQPYTGTGEGRSRTVIGLSFTALAPLSYQKKMCTASARPRENRDHTKNLFLPRGENHYLGGPSHLSTPQLFSVFAICMTAPPTPSKAE